MTLLAYGAMATLAFAMSEAREESPLITTPHLRLSSEGLVVSSLVIGGAFAAFTIACTHFFLKHVPSARTLAQALKSAVTPLPARTWIAMAIIGSVAEELFFRGALVPWLGVFLSSAVFGLLHQVKGEGRFVWAAWATFVGIALGAIFVLTGSLAGPIVAHVAINLVNMHRLKGEAAEETPTTRVLASERVARG